VGSVDPTSEEIGCAAPPKKADGVSAGVAFANPRRYAGDMVGREGQVGARQVQKRMSFANVEKGDEPQLIGKGMLETSLD
jgi:hypothetical protein